MAKRHNHYEAAFEDYLRAQRVAYIAVDESRRALDPDGPLKSVDFLVSPATGARWLVDVKGRRFPSGRQYWRNWTTREEFESLARWDDRFGDAFLGVLVFAYELTADRSPTPPHEVHRYRRRDYAFVALPAKTYARLARPLSPRWGTVAVPAEEFRSAARTVADALGLDEIPPSTAGPDLLIAAPSN